MDFDPSPELEALRASARRFTEEELVPRELEVERGGKLPATARSPPARPWK
jgi:alkylation response protein AidB-like acyl-CoA dehydrogenase